VNLSVFSASGVSIGRSHVHLAPHDKLVSFDQARLGYAEWMPWQIAQAEKEAHVEREARVVPTQSTPMPKQGPKTTTEQLDELDRFFQENFGGSQPSGPATNPLHKVKAEQIKQKLQKGELLPEHIVVFFL
jgi:hypothetical protein